MCPTRTTGFLGATNLQKNSNGVRLETPTRSISWQFAGCQPAYSLRGFCCATCCLILFARCGVNVSSLRWHSCCAGRFICVRWHFFFFNSSNHTQPFALFIYLFIYFGRLMSSSSSSFSPSLTNSVKKKKKKRPSDVAASAYLSSHQKSSLHQTTNLRSPEEDLRHIEGSLRARVLPYTERELKIERERKKGLIYVHLKVIQKLGLVVGDSVLVLPDQEGQHGQINKIAVGTAWLGQNVEEDEVHLDSLMVENCGTKFGGWITLGKLEACNSVVPSSEKALSTRAWRNMMHQQLVVADAEQVVVKLLQSTSQLSADARVGPTLSLDPSLQLWIRQCLGGASPTLLDHHHQSDLFLYPNSGKILRRRQPVRYFILWPPTVLLYSKAQTPPRHIR